MKKEQRVISFPHRIVVMENITTTPVVTADLDSVYKWTVFQVLKILVIVPVSCGGALGNSVVILVILRSNKLKRIFPAFLIVNLAVADFLIGSVVLPITTLGNWKFSEWSCFLLTEICISCCFASIFTLSVLSIDRYIGVTQPLRYMRIMTFKTNVLVLILIWILSLLVSFGPTLIWPIPASKCLQKYNFEFFISKYLLFYFAGPLGIIFTLYWRMYRLLSERERERFASSRLTRIQSPCRQNPLELNLRTHAGGQSIQISNSRELGDSRRQQAQKQKQQKIARMFCLVTFSFAFAWLPYFTILFLNILGVDFLYKPNLAHIFVSIGHSSSCFNPFIYAANFRSFRKAFKDFLVCRWTTLPNEAESSTFRMQQISE